MSKVEDDLDDVKDEKKKKKEKSLIHTKIIIRRLPVGMNKAQFLEQFQPLPEHDYFRFVGGDRSLAPNNYPRAYINFVNFDDIVGFRDTWDGSELESNAGLKSVCVVEYAPFQKVPKKGRKKEDAKLNTIEKDADYIKFLDALEEKEEKQTIDVEKFLEELDLRDKQNQKPVETPLTTFVKQRREDRRRMREERRKQDIERRKKKEEERRKRREIERKKKLDIEKSKRKERSDHEIDGKKTLAETRREMQENNRLKQNAESKDESSSKIKLLQKKEGNDSVNDSKTDDGESRMPSGRGHREFRSRPPPRDYPPRRFQRDEYQRPVSARNKESNSNKDQDSKDEKFRNRKPDREIYYPGSGRGGGRGGYRGGRGARPQKYSEQRNRRPSENEK